ncbi:MAG: prepilin peptidase [Dehalococcoidia bacterium]|nr:prepilin peptidase [Dehalococcoidia bacterium]
MNASFFLLGLAVGSFLNVCADRLPRRQSLIRPPSHCDVCQHRLCPLDLIPLLSYLYLKGKCRYCGAPISYRMPVVEAATGITFVVLWSRLGFSVELPLAMLFACLFIIIIVIDIEHHLIFNRVIYPAIGLAFLLPLLSANYEITSAVLGGVTGAGILFILVLIFPAGIGMGDVKLAALVGLLIGFPEIFIALFVASLVGGVVAVGLLLFKVKGRKDAVPFAPFLIAGFTVAVLYYNEILGFLVNVV